MDIEDFLAQESKGIGCLIPSLVMIGAICIFFGFSYVSNRQEISAEEYAEVEIYLDQIPQLSVCVDYRMKDKVLNRFELLEIRGFRDQILKERSKDNLLK